LTPLGHPESLHPQDGNHPHTNGEGNLEHGPTILFRQRVRGIKQSEQLIVIFAIPTLFTSKGTGWDISHGILLASNMQRHER
jgi:hypothetical protein